MTQPHEDFAHHLGAASHTPPDARGLARLARLAARSARAAGAAAVASGHWLADTLIDVAPRIPVRDLAVLQLHHGGLTGPALAGELVRSASRRTAALGAAAGALAGAEQLSPPAWLAIPVELVVETMAVAAVEMKLIAELHEVYGRPVPGHGRERGLVLARAWAEGRGVSPAMLTSATGLAQLLGTSARKEIARQVRRRFMRRTVRSMSALAPLFAGAVAGAEMNRRGTRSLGEAVIRDLAASPPGTVPDPVPALLPPEHFGG